MKFLLTHYYTPEVSVNNCFNAGDVKRGLKHAAKDWKSSLTLMFKNHLQFCDRELKPPIQIMFRLHAPSSVRRVDAGNFAKILEDAIFDALPFDDHDDNLVRGPYTGVKSDNKEGKFCIIIQEIENKDEVYDEVDLAFLGD